MDANTLLKREIDYTKVWGIALTSLVLWLAPKYLRSPLAWELAAGVGATSAMLTAANEVRKLEQQAMYDRVQLAAQQDLFTSEMAMEVYLQQLQQQQQLQQLQRVQPPLDTSLPQHQLLNAESHISQQIQPSESPATYPIASGPEIFNIQELRHYPSAIIFGPQGSGKTTLTKLIVQDRMQSGHTCEALDPHGSQWPCPSIGAGMDYGSIATRLSEITDLIQQRYQYCREHEVDPNDVDFPPVSLICDEFTNWGTRINNELVVSFIRECWSDIRKIDIMALFLNHTNTIEGGLSGANGLAALRDNGCIQVELFAQKDPVTEKAIPTGTGKLYRPGQPPVDIVIPQLQRSGTVHPVNGNERERERLERSFSLGYSLSAHTVQNGLNVHEPTVQPPFCYLNETQKALIAQAIATGQGKEKSINAILGISKGGSSAWATASQDWDRLKEMMG